MASRRLLLVAGAAYLMQPLLQKLLNLLRRGTSYGGLDGAYRNRSLSADPGRVIECSRRTCSSMSDA